MFVFNVIIRANTRKMTMMMMT